MRLTPHRTPPIRYVSDHHKLPPRLTLEFERVLSPCLLDAHNRYAGAEYVTGHEARGTLHQKGLVERRQCRFVTDVLRGALERLLLDGEQGAALEFCGRMASALLSGEVPSHLLVEGGFLKRCVLCWAAFP
jgi:DNA polymerase elongation subunit (family B)